MGSPPTLPSPNPWRILWIEEKMFESEFDYTLERENMEKVRKNVEKRWGDRWALGKMSAMLAFRAAWCTVKAACPALRRYYPKDFSRTLHQTSALYGHLGKGTQSWY